MLRFARAVEVRFVLRVQHDLPCVAAAEICFAEGSYCM